MTETQSTRTGRKTRCHPGKHPGMLYIVTRDRGGRDDVMRKSPIRFAVKSRIGDEAVYVPWVSTKLEAFEKGKTFQETIWILSKTSGRAEISQETFMIICTVNLAISAKLSSGKYAFSRSNNIGRR